MKLQTGLRRPVPLKKGDKAALIAPSSPVPEKNLIAAVESLKFLGLEPVVFPSCTLSHGYLSGSDDARSKDVNDAFADSSIMGIFCLRGGFGVTRILPKIDFENIRRNPKVFVGYSDITGLHTAINKLCGFVTFHGPMPNTNYTRLDEYTLASLQKNIFSNEHLGLVPNPFGQELETVNKGVSEGIITGGNVSLLLGTLGSPYEVDTKGKILFLEDVGERPYRLDKALTALALAGKFEDCAGIILGTFAECEEPDPGTVAPNTVIANSALTLHEIFEEVIKPFNKPTLLNFRAGHIYPQSTIPLGSMVKMDSTKREIIFI
ncbi:MAG: LD-carboxypeptidase [Aminipila sp.]